MRSDELDYPLPTERIAIAPAEPRDAAKLMVIDRATQQVQHRHVRDLPGLNVLRPGDLLVFNQTRVLPANFHGRRAATGGRINGLFLEAPQRGVWHVMLEARGSLQPGEAIELDKHARLHLIQRRGGGEWSARLDSDQETPALLERIGATPLPPYIRAQRRAHHLPEVQPEDQHRYNTVFAADPGSVAAPTAGLHFTPELLAHLERQGVRRAFLTLHIGLGTFAPIRTVTVEEHPIHSEWIQVPPATIQALRRTRGQGRRIICVGTTTVRALESLPDLDTLLAEQPYIANTSLLIAPGFNFRFTDALLTNFHLPHSTLLALVAALPGVGIERLKRWYTQAVQHQYRFYSFGDAMLMV